MARVPLQTGGVSTHMTGPNMTGIWTFYGNQSKIDRQAVVKVK